MNDYSFERGLLLTLSPLLFFGGLIGLIVFNMDFWFCFLPIVMGVIDLIVLNILFPIKKELK